MSLVSVLLLGVWAAPVASDASAGERPNILLAIADDASFPHMSAYGTKWISTPSFDRVAREGLLFTRCYTPNAKCAPSLSCILTGRNSWQLEEAANHWCTFPTKFPSFIEVLAEHGYATGMTGKGWGPGIAVDRQGDRRELTGKNFSSRHQPPPASGISANDYAANFTDFLDTVKADQPFCFWYGGIEPHRVYEYASGVNKGQKRTEEIGHVPSYWPDNEVVRNDLLDYAFEIEHFDLHLGHMLAELEQRGLLQNTIVVVTSDNGMPFPRAKGNCYDLSNHLPLAIQWPAGINSPGRTVTDLISFIDFAPTFLQLADIDWSGSGMQPASGKSMHGLFENRQETPHRQFVLIGKERHDIGRPGDVGYPVRGIVVSDFLLLQNYETDRWPAGNPETGYLNTDGSPTKTEVLQLRRLHIDNQAWQACFGKRSTFELYNLATDPDCVTNLAGNPAYFSEQTQLLELMNRQLIVEQDPRSLGAGDAFDRYRYADEAGFGFYEEYILDPDPRRASWVNESDFESLPIVPKN